MSYASELRPIVRATGRAGGGLLAWVPREQPGITKAVLTAPPGKASLCLLLTLTLGSYVTSEPQFPHLQNRLSCEPGKIHLPKVLS